MKEQSLEFQPLFLLQTILSLLDVLIGNECKMAAAGSLINGQEEMPDPRPGTESQGAHVEV